MDVGLYYCQRFIDWFPLVVYIVRTLEVFAMKKYNLYLSEQQINALVLLSEQKGISVSELIRRALDEYIEKEHRKTLLPLLKESTKKTKYHDRTND